MFNFKEAIKKPWVKYALIAVGVIGAYVVFKSATGSSGSSSSSSSDSTAPSDAEVQASAAVQMNQDNIAAAQAAQGTALQQQSASIAGSLTAQKEDDTTQIALANVQLAGLQQQLNEAQADHLSDNATVLGGETLVAQTQQLISDNQTSVAIGQSNNQVKTAVQQKQGATTSTILSGLGLAAAAFF
jgi:hypothetical protein